MQAHKGSRVYDRLKLELGRTRLRASRDSRIWGLERTVRNFLEWKQINWSARNFTVKCEKKTRPKHKIVAGLKFYTWRFLCCAKLKTLLSIGLTCSRFVVLDFKRDEHITPDLRALNWLSVANRRCLLQTSALLYLSFSLYLKKDILFMLQGYIKTVQKCISLVYHYILITL